jgi:small redox-active disulfide protein 2
LEELGVLGVFARINEFLAKAQRSQSWEETETHTMKIQILGTGCSRCKTLAANAEAAVKSLGIKAVVEKVDNITDIMKFGVMTTPALVVDG